MKRKAFTLIELMLVVIIIGALAAMVVPRLAGRVGKALIATAGADITGISVGLGMFELDNGRFPNTEEGLKALMTKPSWAAKWAGPYLTKKPIDPWENEFKYVYPGKHGPDYDLYSLGPDGKESADDIGNWQ